MSRIVLTRDDLYFDDNGNVVDYSHNFNEVLTEYVNDGLKNPSYYEYKPSEWIELDNRVVLVNLYKPNIRYSLSNCHLDAFYDSHNMDWDEYLCECLDYEREDGCDYEDYDHKIWLSFRDSVVFNFDNEIHKEYYNRDEDIYDIFKEILIESINEWDYNYTVNKELLIDCMLKLLMEFCALILGEIDEFVSSDGFSDMIFECFTIPYTDYMVKSILEDGGFSYFKPNIVTMYVC